MDKLVGLELMRIPLKPYTVATGIITLSMLAFTYLSATFFSFGGDPALDLFAIYDNIVTIISLVNSLCFAIMSAVMFSKYVIEEYTGKGAVLLFSYPVSRSKILLAKIQIASVFILINATISNLIVLGVFFVTELLFPLINDTVTASIVIKTIVVSTSFALIACGVGTLSMRIGFWKKSAIATVVSALLIMSVVSQIFSATLGSNIIPIVFDIVFVIISALILSGLFREVTKMEAVQFVR